MPKAKKRKREEGDPLEAYRRVRKPMPPPERVIPDKRRKKVERDLEREARDEQTEARTQQNAEGGE